MSTRVEKKQLKQNALLVDAGSCIGCHSCEVACKLEHDLPEGPRIIKIIQIGPLETGDGLWTDFVAVTCFHCDRPACVIACPTGAMQKRSDGLVYSDAELCIGCQTCAVACPFGIPQLNPKAGKIAKCDGCMERVDQGLWPVCALKCPTSCLRFGSPGRIVHDRRQERAVRIVQAFPKD